MGGIVINVISHGIRFGIKLKVTNNADGREKDGNEDEEGKKNIRTICCYRY